MIINAKYEKQELQGTLDVRSKSNYGSGDDWSSVLPLTNDINKVKK
ncbi:MAG: hypothetical protein ABI045_05805 [Flavobacteriales bacterium]